MNLDKNSGFTLIELIIVVIIIGILAAIAAPMMSGNVKSAKIAEARSMLGGIRTAERLYYAEKNTIGYVVFSDLGNYMNKSDIDGQYFANGDLTITPNTSNSKFVAQFTGNTTTTAPKSKEVAGILVNIDQNGNLANN